jgi:hypothetical protein
VRAKLGRQGGKVDKEEEQKRIKTHEDLVIYQKSFKVVMTIFELSNSFLRKKDILSRIKYVVLLVQCVRILHNPGEFSPG